MLHSRQSVLYPILTVSRDKSIGVELCVASIVFHLDPMTSGAIFLGHLCLTRLCSVNIIRLLTISQLNN